MIANEGRPSNVLDLLSLNLDFEILSGKRRTCDLVDIDTILFQVLNHLKIGIVKETGNISQYRVSLFLFVYTFYQFGNSHLCRRLKHDIKLGHVHLFAWSRKVRMFNLIKTKEKSQLLCSASTPEYLISPRLTLMYWQLTAMIPSCFHCQESK